MPFRFRRSIKILPGIRLNVSKSGVSTSVGVRGAHVTVGHGRVRETVGLPGTGVSYTESQPLHPDSAAQAPPTGEVPRAGRRRWIGWALLLIVLIWAWRALRP